MTVESPPRPGALQQLRSTNPWAMTVMGPPRPVSAQSADPPLTKEAPASRYTNGRDAGTRCI
eukprot:5180721-Lingulodinium_polyedra.AAC.1